jgi:hypothetical protein
VHSNAGAVVTFSITHISGAMELDPSKEAVRALLDELDTADAEHPDVALSHESGWTLSAFSSSRLVWENIEGDEEPRHRDNVPRHEVVRLFDALASGNMPEVEAQPWTPGYS